MDTEDLIDRLEMMDFMIRHREVYRTAPIDSKNPVYTWMGLIRALAPQARSGAIAGSAFPETVTLPGWIAEYLSEASLQIIMLYMGIDTRVLPAEDMEDQAAGSETLDEGQEQDEDLVDPKDAMGLLPAALGLRRDGWNAFRAVKADRDKIEIFRKFEDHCRSGMTARDAEFQLQADLGLADDRSVRRRIAEGKALVAAREPWAEPTP